MVVLVRIIDGTLKKGQKVKLMATGAGTRSSASYLPTQAEMLRSSARARSASRRSHQAVADTKSATP